MSSVNRREGLLNEALGYVTKDRNSSYGEPEDNFQAIADIWNAQGYSKGKDYDLLTAVDVALMMTGMKLARLRHNSAHRDSWVDLIGYGACGGGIALESVDDGLGKYKGTDVVEEYVYSNSEPVDKTLSAWWISDYRCGHDEVHVSHKYTRSSGGAILWDNSGLEWCDGYTSSRRAVESNIGTMSSVQQDVDAVKRVADKGAHDLFKKCGKFPACSVCGPQHD